MTRAWIAALALAALAVPAAAREADTVDGWIARTGVEPSVAAPMLTPMDGGWDFRVTAWVIAPKANIESEIGGSGGHVETDLGDTFISGVRVEMVRKTFGVLFELQAGGLDSEDVPGDYSLTDMRADVGLIVRVLGGDAGDGLRLDLFGGARYHRTEQDVTIDDDDAWWEPFLGTEVRVPFPIGTLFGRLTASGFDVGPTTLQLTATAGIEFLVGPVFVQVGLFYEDQHFSSGTGGGYEVDAQSIGPFVAAGVDF